MGRHYLHMRLLGCPHSAHCSAWHRAVNCCQMNEPEGEMASGVLGPVWLWPRALPCCHSQDTGTQRGQLSLQSGLGGSACRDRSGEIIDFCPFGIHFWLHLAK